MSPWTPFPYDASAYRYEPDALHAVWSRLHAGDAEPLPADADVLNAWALFHAGRFEEAVAAGLKAGGAGITVANKAQSAHAGYLESREEVKLGLFLEVAERAEAQISSNPGQANAHFFMAAALGRYSQGISIAKALAQGLGGKIKGALETTLRLAPNHADAHVALGAFHAEVIDKLGSLLGRTQGASKDSGLSAFRTAIRLNPTSAIAKVEYANGWIMLEGEKRVREATALYEQAAACEPMDAMERLDVEMARAGLRD